MTIWFEDRYCYYAWKPHGIASTWGKWPCFLDCVNAPQIQNDTPVLPDLSNHFSAVEEYWLLNRLDNDTAWLLYFAKNHANKKTWKDLQQQGRLIKYYLADVIGDVDWQRKCIAYPIIHHPQAKDRMLCVTKHIDNFQKLQYCETWVEKLFYDREKNYSCLLVMINKWVRHQIRCHLASIGCPIIGENIYKKRKDAGILHLWSIGIKSI